MGICSASGSFNWRCSGTLSTEGERSMHSPAPESFGAFHAHPWTEPDEDGRRRSRSTDCAEIGRGRLPARRLARRSDELFVPYLRYLIMIPACFLSVFGTVWYRENCIKQVSYSRCDIVARDGIKRREFSLVCTRRRRPGRPRLHRLVLETTQQPQGCTQVLEELLQSRFSQNGEGERKTIRKNLEILQRNLDWRQCAFDVRRLRVLASLVEAVVPLETLPEVLNWLQGCVHEHTSSRERVAMFWCLVHAWERLLLRYSSRSLLRRLQRTPTGAITFSAILCALSRRMHCMEAKELWQTLVAQRIPVSSYALGYLLQAHLRAGEPEQVPILFGLMADHGCMPDRFALNILLNSLGRMGQAREAFALFRLMRENHVANNITYNVLLSMCRRLGLVSGALALKADMDRQPSIEPDPMTYLLLMTLLASVDRPLEMQTLYQEMRSRKLPLTGSALNAYIGFLYKRGKFEFVLSVYLDAIQGCMEILQSTPSGVPADPQAGADDLTNHTLVPDEESPCPDRRLSGLACGLNQDPAALRKAALMHLNAPADTFVHVVLACTKSLLKAEAVQAYQDMQACGHRLNNGGYNALIELCCRSGDIARGLELFTEMRRLGLEPNTTTYALVIRDIATLVADVQRQLSRVTCSSMDSVSGSIDSQVLQERAHLLIRQALQFFADMRSRSHAPSRMVYKALVQACAATGQAKNLAELLIAHETTPSSIEQLVAAELVDSLLDQRHIETALRFVEHMAVLGLRLSVITCRTLIDTLGRAKDANGVMRICSLMLKHGIEINHITLRIIERALMHHDLPQHVPSHVEERAKILLQRLRAGQ